MTIDLHITKRLDGEEWSQIADRDGSCRYLLKRVQRLLERNPHRLALKDGKWIQP